MTPPESPPQDRLIQTLRRDRGKMLGFVRSRLSRRLQDQDAEDVLSDVILGLLERADLLASVENLSAYMITALGNRIRDLLRKRRDIPMPNPPPPDSAQPATAGDRLELEQAFSVLSTAERAVWVAIELDGRSFADLVLEWGEPLGTLLSRKNRAQKKMQQALEKE